MQISKSHKIKGSACKKFRREPSMSKNERLGAVLVRALVSLARPAILRTLDHWCNLVDKKMESCIRKNDSIDPTKLPF